MILTHVGRILYDESLSLSEAGVPIGATLRAVFNNNGNAVASSSSSGDIKRVAFQIPGREKQLIGTFPANYTIRRAIDRLRDSGILPLAVDKHHYNATIKGRNISLDDSLETMDDDGRSLIIVTIVSSNADDDDRANFV